MAAAFLFLSRPERVARAPPCLPRVACTRTERQPRCVCTRIVALSSALALPHFGTRATHRSVCVCVYARMVCVCVWVQMRRSSLLCVLPILSCVCTSIGFAGRCRASRCRQGKGVRAGREPYVALLHSQLGGASVREVAVRCKP